MILMSLSMLGWLPWWLVPVPRLPMRLYQKADGVRKSAGPFTVGLINGLLPCGPLQAMQLYALSTGSVGKGALSMFLFAIGTVPLMLGTGLVFSLLKGKFLHGIARTGAALVLLMGFLMAVNAGGLLGWNAAADTPPVVTQTDTAEDKTQDTVADQLEAKGYAVAEIHDGVQVVEAGLRSSRYPSIAVQKGIPVEFNLTAEAKSLNGCNETVALTAFGVEKHLKAGDNIIEFTPEQAGAVTYTCWMGMIRANILVVDDLSAPQP